MPVLPFRKTDPRASANGGISRTLDGYSIEVMPRTAAKIEDFRAILPEGTRVYIAHIEGTPIDDMISTARRLTDDGFAVMPHFPARIIEDEAQLRNWVARYAAEAGVSQALVLGGSPTTPLGALDSSMQLLQTGAFQENGYARVHVAGHPEGNRDIDRDGGTRLVDEALTWKQTYARDNGLDMAIVTQFAFEADGVISWARRLRERGIDLPIHLGIAGPAKLQTLIKFSVACGVGPSLKVLQRRARDLTKLVLPFEPDDILAAVADATDPDGDPVFEQMHIFPLGGIKAASSYAARYGVGTPDAVAAAGGQS
jgi:methylenetetrahydrofolate reductase (NADPH)